MYARMKIFNRGKLIVEKLPEKSFYKKTQKWMSEAAGHGTTAQY